MDTKKEAQDIIEKLKAISTQLEYKDNIISNLNSQLEKSKELIIKLNQHIEEDQKESFHVKNLLKTKIIESKQLKQEVEEAKKQSNDYKTQLISSKYEIKEQLSKLKQIYDEKLNNKEIEHSNYQLELKNQLDKLNNKETKVEIPKQTIPQKSMIFDNFEEDPNIARERRIQEIINTIKLAQQHGDTREGIKLSLLNMGHDSEHIDEAIRRLL